MKENFTLESPGLAINLRTALESDCADLRRWKNAHRHRFFYQQVISAEQQREWYQAYRERATDWMFVVQYAERALGCMGFRILEDARVDIYNVILGEPSLGGRGFMSQAIQLMCSYIVAQFSSEIVAKVLHSSPALDWYLKNGFRRAKAYDTYAEIVLDRSQFRPYPFQKIELG